MADGDGNRTFLGVSFHRNISVGTIAVLLVEIIGGSFVAGMVWKSVVETPTQIETLKATVDKRFGDLETKLAGVTGQAGQIADLYARQHDLQARQDAEGADIVQLKVDMRGTEADVSNLKAATAACVPGDLRLECRRGR